jgi:hypothetical protein
LETGCTEKAIKWQFFHFLSTSPYSSRQTFWSRQSLYDHETSRASFALYFKSLLISLFLASEEFISELPSSKHLSSSASYPLDLTGLGDPTGGNATIDVAL